MDIWLLNYFSLLFLETVCKATKPNDSKAPFPVCTFQKGMYSSSLSFKVTFLKGLPHMSDCGINSVPAFISDTMAYSSTFVEMKVLKLGFYVFPLLSILSGFTLLFLLAHQAWL